MRIIRVAYYDWSTKLTHRQIKAGVAIVTLRNVKNRKPIKKGFVKKDNRRQTCVFWKSVLVLLLSFSTPWCLFCSWMSGSSSPVEIFLCFIWFSFSKDSVYNNNISVFISIFSCKQQGFPSCKKVMRDDIYN